MANASAIKFFCENVGLTGFDTENALFMTCKELFDNSMDACRKREHGQWGNLMPKIQVSVMYDYILDGNDPRLSIRVQDTGCGISLESIDLLGTLFGTSKKVKTKHFYSGQFGVGLKMILLYATQHGKGMVQVKMRMDDSIWLFKLLCDINTGTFYVGESEKLQLKNWEWVTEFTVILHLNLDPDKFGEKCTSTKDHCKKSMDKLKSYMSLSRLWYQDITVKLNTNLYDVDIIWPPKNVMTFQELLNNKWEYIYSDKHSKYKVQVVFGFLDTETFKISEENLMDPYKSGNLYVYRSANGMPIFSKEVATCDILSAIKTFLKRYGASFGIKPNPKFTEYPKQPCDVIDKLKGSETPISITIASHAQYVHRVLFVNVSGYEIQYGTLGKTSLKSNSGLSVLIQQTLRVLLKNLQERFPKELMHVKDFTMKHAISTYCPIMAQNISSMILRSNSVLFKKGLLSIISKHSREDSKKLNDLINSHNEDKEQIQAILERSLSEWLLANYDGIQIQERNTNAEDLPDSEFAVTKDKILQEDFLD
ncbi:hypothetical protein cand_026280 [Cryptosporidium andersoni]|uniref:Histidine kinase/HSP90-like ATPase domain-containing protein n=1 Tax=Cryptosporidium andersoni TaxID=117008 RepID=A0A1J4MDV5_9CRYT|nr:hypothetical protein cand_026280 [Cryptosporidium andersoni]